MYINVKWAYLETARYALHGNTSTWIISGAVSGIDLMEQYRKIAFIHKSGWYLLNLSSNI
jgi:hypothetical protein